MKCATILLPSLSVRRFVIHQKLPVASMMSRSFNLNARFNIYVITRRMFIMCKRSRRKFGETFLSDRGRKQFGGKNIAKIFSERRVEAFSHLEKVTFICDKILFSLPSREKWRRNCACFGVGIAAATTFGPC